MYRLWANFLSTCRIDVNVDSAASATSGKHDSQ